MLINRSILKNKIRVKRVLRGLDESEVLSESRTLAGRYVQTTINCDELTDCTECQYVPVVDISCINPLIQNVTNPSLNIGNIQSCYTVPSGGLSVPYYTVNIPYTINSSISNPMELLITTNVISTITILSNTIQIITESTLVPTLNINIDLVYVGETFARDNRNINITLNQITNIC